MARTTSDRSIGANRTMNNNALIFNGVDFGHESAPDALFSDLSAHFPCGFTGIVGPNGAGKTTLLKLATGALVPERGSISSPVHGVYCAQRTDTRPDGLGAFMHATDKRAHQLRWQLGLSDRFLDN